MNPYERMPYAPYGNPYPQYSVPQQEYSPPPQQPIQQPDSNMIWVQGTSGGNAYPLQSGKSAVLFDTEAKRFFIKTVDTSGMPQPLRVFNYTEETEDDKNETPAIDTSMFVTREEFEKFVSSVKEKQQPHNNNQRKDGNRNGKPIVQ